MSEHDCLRCISDAETANGERLPHTCSHPARPDQVDEGGGEAGAALDYQQGRLLDTPQTLRWTPEQRAEGERQERLRIFKGFRSHDAGRSRRYMAECRTQEDAAQIIADFSTLRKCIRRLSAETAQTRQENERLRAECEGLRAVSALRQALEDDIKPTSVARARVETLMWALQQARDGDDPTFICNRIENEISRLASPSASGGPRPLE